MTLKQYHLFMYIDAFPILEDVDWLLLLLMYSNLYQVNILVLFQPKPAMEMMLKQPHLFTIICLILIYIPFMACFFMPHRLSRAFRLF
jgi:phosphoglycerol transferase MdoB-like AlkP superfamily enzyme